MFTSLMTKHESKTFTEFTSKNLQKKPPKTYRKNTAKHQVNCHLPAGLPLQQKPSLRSTSKPSRCGSICNSSLGRKRCNTGPSISKDILSQRSPRALGPQNGMPRDGQMSRPSRSSNLEWFVPRTRFRLDPAENVIDGSDGVQLCSFPTTNSTHESSSYPAVIKLEDLLGPMFIRMFHCKIEWGRVKHPHSGGLLKYMYVV